jgi:hypothetical protein
MTKSLEDIQLFLNMKQTFQPTRPQNWDTFQFSHFT